MLDFVTVCLPGGFDRWYLLTRYHVAEMAAVQARTRRLEIIVTSICHVSRVTNVTRPGSAAVWRGHGR